MENYSTMTSGMKTNCDTVKSIIDGFPSRRQLADILGVSVARVQKWAQGGAIPAAFHAEFIEAAQAHDLPVDADMITRLHRRTDRAAAA